MPNLVKIGKTESQDPRIRMDQLYNTSVPLPFELVRAVRVQDEEAVEKKIHGVFPMIASTQNANSLRSQLNRCNPCSI